MGLLCAMILLSAHTVVEGLGPSNLSAASRLWQVGHVSFFGGIALAGCQPGR